MEGVELSRGDKSRAHAYIATRSQPQHSVGVAALRGYWDMAHPALADARRFLTAL